MASGQGNVLIVLAATCICNGVFARQVPSGRYRPGLVPDAQIANSAPPSGLKVQLQPADVALAMKLNADNVRYQQEGCEHVRDMVPPVNKNVHDAIQAAARTRETTLEANSTAEPDGKSEVVEPGTMSAKPAFSTIDLEDIKMIQGAVLDSEVPVLAIEAMRKFPDELKLQVACTKMLTSVAAWNDEAAAGLGKLGVVKAVVTALDRFQDEGSMRELIGSIAHLNDYNAPNRNRMQHLGVVHLLYDVQKANPDDPVLELNIQRLLSTLCLHPYAMKEMFDHAYIRNSIKAMRKFSDVPALRGEVMETFRNCFMVDPIAQNRMLEEGIVDEIIESIGDSHSLQKFDLLGDVRLQYNALTIMTDLSAEKPSVRETFLQKGVLQQMVKYLDSDDVASKNVLDYDRIITTCKGITSLLGLKQPASAWSFARPRAAPQTLTEANRNAVRPSKIMEVLIKKVALRPNDELLQTTCRPLMHAWF